MLLWKNFFSQQNVTHIHFSSRMQVFVKAYCFMIYSMITAKSTLFQQIDKYDKNDNQLGINYGNNNQQSSLKILGRVGGDHFAGSLIFAKALNDNDFDKNIQRNSLWPILGILSPQQIDFT